MLLVHTIMPSSTHPAKRQSRSAVRCVGQEECGQSGASGGGGRRRGEGQAAQGAAQRQHWQPENGGQQRGRRGDGALWRAGQRGHQAPVAVVPPSGLGQRSRAGRRGKRPVGPSPAANIAASAVGMRTPLLGRARSYKQGFCSRIRQVQLIHFRALAAPRASYVLICSG